MCDTVPLAHTHAMHCAVNQSLTSFQLSELIQLRFDFSAVGRRMFEQILQTHIAQTPRGLGRLEV